MSDKGTSGERSDSQAEAILGHYRRAFPADRIPGFRKLRPNQERALAVNARHPLVVHEMPTGDGKSAVEYAELRAHADLGQKCFWLFPNKAILQQIATIFPDVHVVYGRGEFPCWYHEEDKADLPQTAQEAQERDGFKADEIPCAMLRTCPHRVDQTTGETYEPGAARCPYLQQKYEAKQKKGAIIATTFAFYLFSVVMAREWPEEPNVLVVDEVDQLPKQIRNLMSVEISDQQLGRIIGLLEQAGIEDAAAKLRAFLALMKRAVRKRCRDHASLLSDEDTQKMLEILESINGAKLRKDVGDAIRSGKVFDPKSQRGALKSLEAITQNVSRYVNAIRFALPEPKRATALNYVFGSWEREPAEGSKIRFRVHIRCYAVGPMLRRMCAPVTKCYSATIGDLKSFQAESGLYEAGTRNPRGFHYETYGSDFPAENTAIIIPRDAPDLSQKNRRPNQPGREIRRLAEKILWFKRRKMRCLFLVVSNDEKKLAIEACEKLGLLVITYGGEVTARQAAECFRDGEGDVLIGTTAQFAYGIDLPHQSCPVTITLRPDYPSPTDPEAQFEQKRFGMACWGIRHSRVVRTSLQKRGRNIRSKRDRGVTIYASSQFRRFLRGCLPEWLKDAYVDDLNLDDACEHAVSIVRGEKPKRKPKGLPPGCLPEGERAKVHFA